MSETLGSLVVEIGAKVEGLTSALKSVQDSLNQTKENTEKTHGAFGGLWAQFAVGQIAANALQKGIGFLTDAVKSSITGAIEAEAAENRLKIALDSTGRATAEILPNLIEFSTQLQKETTYSDDAAQGAMTLLAQLTDLDENGIKKATQGAMGLATVFGMDLNSAASLVAKAMAGNEGALSRYGIKVDETLPKEQQHADLLNRLATMFQQSTAETETFGGQIKQLGNFFDEVKERVGGALVNNQAFKDLIEKVQTAVVNLIESGKLDEWITKISDALTFAIDNLGFFIDMLGGMASGGVQGSLEVVADHLTGIDDLCSELEKAGRMEVASFAKSLGDLKIPTEELRAQIELGKASWEAYKTTITQNKDATLALKGSVESYLTKGAELLGLAKHTAPEVKKVGEEKKKAAEETKKLAEAAKAAAEKQKALDAEFYGIKQTIVNEVNPALSALEQKMFDLATSDDYQQTIDNVNSTLDAIAAKAAETGDAIEDDQSETTGNVSTFWEDLIRDITIGWADGLQGLVEGTKSFGDFLSETWGAIKQTFFRLIADMLVKWLVGLIAPMVAGTTTAAATMSGAFAGVGATLTAVVGAIAGVITALIGVVATGIVTIATAIAGAIVALATGIAAAATALAAAAPALLTVGAVALVIYAGFQAIQSLIGSGNGGAGDGMGRVVERQDRFLAVWTWWAPQVAELLTALQELGTDLCEKIDNLAAVVAMVGNWLLKATTIWDGKIVNQVGVVVAAINNWGKNIVDAINAIEGYASGGVAWTPQLATVAESGPEIIIPLDEYRAGTGLAGVGTGGYGASAVHITQNIYAQNLDRATIDRSAEYLYAAMQRQMARRGM